MELDEILGGTEKPETPPAETPQTPETPATPETPETGSEKGARQAFKEKEAAAQAEGRARDATGKFVAEEKPEEKPEVKEPPKQEMSEKEKAFLAQAQDERRKRQQLEQELNQLRAAQPKSQEPAKTFWDDPEGTLNQQREALRREAQMTVVQARIAASEIVAKNKYPDFDEVVTEFGQLLQTVPGLYQQWMQQMDPAEYAYKTAKGMKELKAAGSIEEYKKNAEKEARIRLEAEYKAKEQALLKEKEALPDSLSNVRGNAGSRVAWSGPTPLDNILKH